MRPAQIAPRSGSQAAPGRVNSRRASFHLDRRKWCELRPGSQAQPGPSFYPTRATALWLSQPMKRARFDCFAYTGALGIAAMAGGGEGMSFRLI